MRTTLPAASYHVQACVWCSFAAVLTSRKENKGPTCGGGDAVWRNGALPTIRGLSVRLVTHYPTRCAHALLVVCRAGRGVMPMLSPPIPSSHLRPSRY